MSRQQKITFRVNIDPNMDELFGNLTIIAIKKRRTIWFEREYIPLEEITQDRIQQEIVKVFKQATGITLYGGLKRTK